MGPSGYRGLGGAAAALFLLDAALALAGWLVVTRLLAGELRAAAQLLYPACFVLFLYALGLYRRDALLETRRSLVRAVVAAAFGGVLATVAIELLALWEAADPPGGLGGLFALSIPCFLASTLLARLALGALRTHGAFRRRLLVVGAGLRAYDLIHLLRCEGRTLHYDIAVVHDPSMGMLDERLEQRFGLRVRPLEGGFLAVARAFDADQIVVATDERRGLDMRALLDCRIAGFPVYEYLRFLEDEIRRVDVKRLELGWLLYADGFRFGPLDRALKRMLDVAASAALLLLGSPALLAASVAIRLEDGGPVLYRQQRVTKDGRVFRIMKLRTMRVDAEKAAGAVWAADRDPRITRIGNFLRRSRIDELPQLLNVLRGDMSFVGPRPERPEFTRDLATKLPLYEERHVVRAGLTGWAQVNYPYGASLDDARSKLSYDLYYVKNFSVLFDLLIILQTLRVVLFPGAGAVR
jgi:sugar transferase (PEP-CTERM system associated)